jgi:hypothetical protein
VKNLKNLILLVGIFFVSLTYAFPQEIMYSTSKRIEDCDRELRQRMFVDLPLIFGDVALPAEACPKNFLAPWKFFITKKFYKEAEKILNLVVLLERHPDKIAAIELLAKIDEIIYLQFRQFILTRRTIDQKTKNEMLTVIDQWYAAPTLDNRLLTKTVLTLFHLRDCPWNKEEKLSVLTLMLEREKTSFLSGLKNSDSEVSREKLIFLVDRLKDVVIEGGSSWLGKKIIKYTLLVAAGVFVVGWLIPEIGRIFREVGKNTLIPFGKQVHEAVKDTAINAVDKALGKKDIQEKIDETFDGAVTYIPRKVEKVVNTGLDYIGNTLVQLKDTSETPGFLGEGSLIRE